MRQRYLAALAALICSWGCDTQPVPIADTIFYNGKIVTLDSQSSVVQALAVTDNLVLDTGSDDEILAMAGPETARIDLEGRTVVPGFADNHFHSIGGGPGVDLSRVRDLESLQDAIAERAEVTPEGETILTNSDWHEGQLKEQRLPYRDDLDAASSRHPIVVVRGGHEYILNSTALDKWSIDISTPVPDGGSIGRYPDGRLNGELVDTAKRYVELPPKPELDPDSLADELLMAFRQLNEVGLTSIRYGSSTVEQYRRLERVKDRLSLRVSVLLRVPSSMEPDALGATLDGWDIQPGEGDAWLRVDGIKLGVDGGFEGGWMREPYEEPWGEQGSYFGLQTMQREPFVDIVRQLNARGWRVGTHAVGDAAIDLVLSAYEAADEDDTITGKRWAIEHGFIVRDDQLPRIQALGLHLSAQHHLYIAAPSLVKYWGGSRAASVTPARTYLDAGVPLSLGTDSPVVPYPPLWVLYHFITRNTASAGVMGEDQKLTREEALRAMTLGNAALTFEESKKGSLEPGKLADLVVLSDDILTCAPERIRDMEVVMTMVGGDVVYQK